MQLTNVHVLGLAKAIAEKELKEARDGVGPGQHRVDLFVRIFGTLSIGEDYEAEIVAKVDWMGLATLAMSKLNGITLAKLLEELDNGGEALDAAKEKMKEELAGLKGKTKTKCRGKVTPRLAVERVAKTRIA